MAIFVVVIAVVQSLVFACLSSLLHVFQVFEWWYFRKYGTSFIEQISVNHIGPLLGGDDSESNNGNNNENKQSKPMCLKLKYKLIT